MSIGLSIKARGIGGGLDRHMKHMPDQLPPWKHPFARVPAEQSPGTPAAARFSGKKASGRELKRK